MEKVMKLIKFFIVMASFRSFALDHGLWDQVLKTRVDSYGFFDYKNFIKNKGETEKLNIIINNEN